MTDDNQLLDELFQRYRAACPEVEPSVGFMPQLWEKIDNTRSFPFIFQRVSRVLMTASAAVCLLLVILNMVPMAGASAASTSFASYIDALSADNNVERTYYQDSTRPQLEVPDGIR